jgi:hypothetical protein
MASKPPLLTHDDVITLFHEFGHGLHHMLTQVNERDVAGISGVEWDAVELPSQFMENFCWEWDVLKHMTAHVDTGEPLPRALFDKMLAAKNFQSGLQTLRQVEFSLFDMLLHSQPEPVRPAGRPFWPCNSRCATKWRCCSRRPTAARPTPSATSLLVVIRPATTATSGPRCCRPTPTPPLKKQPRLNWPQHAGCGHRPALPSGHSGSGWQPPGHGVLQGLPGPRAQHRRAAAPPGHGLITRIHLIGTA